jgi:hypothetical protein
MLANTGTGINSGMQQQLSTESYLVMQDHLTFEGEEKQEKKSEGRAY